MKNKLLDRYVLHKTLLVMKLTFALLLIFTLNAFSSAYSQKNRLSLKLKDVSLEKALEVIEHEAGYEFFYHQGRINLTDKVSINVEEESLENILNEVLKDQSVEYRIINQSIILTEKAWVEHARNSAQQKTVEVKGVVKDDKGEPIPGVNVFEKSNVTNGVITGIDGSYNLTVSSQESVIVFSFIGFQEQNINVAGRSEINVTLMEETTGLDEVVVVGYGEQKKVNLTGSVSSVKAEELNNIPMANMSNGMAGRAPGVQVVNTSGLAGASASIRIRGGINEPLYIIDGIVSSKSQFDALDPNEVENINFLKDAASAAVYGAKAGNGVVIITTRKGSKQKPRFNVKSSFSTSRTTQPVQSYTATQELEYVNRMMETRGQEMPYGPDIFDYFKDKSYDINDLIWQNPSVQQHNISVDGGSEKVQYYLSLGYHTEEGSYHNTNYDRYNFRSNITAHITDHFKVNFNVSGNQRNYDRWYWPYDGAEDFNVGDWYRATFNWTRLYPFYTDADGNPTNNPKDYPVGPAGGYHPPEVMLNGGYRRTKHRTLNGILRFDLDLEELVSGLSTAVQANVNAYDRNMKSYVVHNKWYIMQSGDTENKFVPGPIDFTQTKSHNLSSSYPNIQEDVGLSSSYQYNWFLNYDRSFGNHNISAVAVYEQVEDEGKWLYGRAENLLSTNIDQIYNASGEPERRIFSGGESENANASYIGRVNYNFANKYIVEYSFRYDGNYRFAPGKRWGYFPSFSAGWRISEENFMNGIDWLTNLKIRGSYGTTGSLERIDGRSIASWQWTNYYTKSTGFVFGNSLQDGLRPGTMPNTDITWSTVKNWNIGVEYGLFDNKLSGQFDIWGKNVSDILGPRLGSTPTTLGATLPWENYAEREWKGFEISATYKNRVGELKYEIYANMGYAIDEWITYDEPESYTDGTYEGNWRSRIGKPASRVGGLISKGIIRTQEQLDAVPDGYTVFGRQPQIGTILFEDIRGDNYSEGPDGKIDWNDWTYLSENGAPRINYGFGTNLEWKGIAINAHFQGVGAYDRVVATRNSGGGGVFQVDRPYFELWADNYWTPENPNAKYPRIGGNWMQPEFGGGPSSFWMRNGAYLRLKNLNIAYTLPNQWFDKVGLEDVQLFVNGTNLFVISEFKEHDPEQATLDSYPLMKTFTGGLSINF
jgi:TonB-linked SusC/RagA family outer membrane protein